MSDLNIIKAADIPEKQFSLPIIRFTVMCDLSDVHLAGRCGISHNRVLPFTRWVLNEVLALLYVGAGIFSPTLTFVRKGFVL